MDKTLSVARFYFAQCVFMTSIHYKAHNRLYIRERFYRNIGIVIASITLLSIVMQTIGALNNYQRLLEILSYCGLILTSVSIVFLLFCKENLSEIRMQHRNIAEEYKALRDKFMFFIGKIDGDLTIEEKTQVENMIELYSRLGKYSPSTTNNDYLDAQNTLGIEGVKNEEFTWSDTEIDRFFPDNLKKKSKRRTK
jgi:hypothetical protein